MSKHDYKPTKDERRILLDLPSEDGDYVERAFMERDHYKRAYEADHLSLTKQGIVMDQLMTEIAFLRAKNFVEIPLSVNGCGI